MRSIISKSLLGSEKRTRKTKRGKTKIKIKIKSGSAEGAMNAVRKLSRGLGDDK